MKAKDLAVKIEKLPLWVILTVAAVVYLPLIFLGYGSDSDSYAVVRAGQNFAATLDYVPSRLPGFLVHEIFTYFLNLIGGSLLTNLGTVGISLLMLASFYKLCISLSISQPALLTLILMLHPVVWVNAGSTIDYMWALGFAFYGFTRLLSKNFLSASILLALGVGCRLSTLVLVGLFLIFVFFRSPKDRTKVLITGISTLVIVGVFFLPPLDFLEWDFSRWLVLSKGEPALWTPLLRIGRFLYKNIMFWGLPAVLWLVVISGSLILKPRLRARVALDLVAWLSIAVIIVYEILFLVAPIELEYLLPLLPFTLILASKWNRNPGYLVILFLLIFISNFLWINPARSTTPNQTSEVIYGLWLEKGYLMQDISARLAQFTP